MKALTHIFQSIGLDDETNEVRYRLLQDMPDELFEQAVIALCRERKELFPGSNIVALIRERAFPSQNLEARATPAWVKVRMAIREHGAYASIQFDDPVIHSCVEAMGGWPFLCDTET